MEKKGDTFTQLAIISDLLENINIIAVEKKVIFNLASSEFEEIKNLIINKVNVSAGTPDKIVLQIGEIVFEFVKI